MQGASGTHFASAAAYGILRIESLCCTQCTELSDKLAEDMASEGLRGKTITLKLKETNFELRTRDKTLPTYISNPEDIFREAMKLLKPELPIKIRLMVSL